jgi:type I restriction enzyme S subunit
MSYNLQPYPEYKNSGVPWLGEIPAHWAMRSLGSLLSPRSERNQPELPLLSVVREKGVIPRATMSTDENHNYVPDDLSNYKVVYPGDLVMNKMKAWQGSMGISEYKGLVSPAYFVFKHSLAYSLFLHNLLRSKPFVAFFAQASDGVRIGQWDLSITRMRRIPILLPPFAEQTAIIAFLDYLARRINRFIRVKRRMIALLNEQKQAIIHQAVTRGLDPDVKLKPSGVEWLGDVPEHWEIISSRRLFSVRKELSRPDDVQLSATQAYGVIPQAKFEELVGRRVVKISMHLEKRRHVEKDDFVISMRSFQGGLERAWTSGAIRSSYVVLKSQANIDINFFEYLFKSYGYIRALQATADFIRDGQDLTYANFRMVDLPLLPLDEQRAIATFIAQAVTAIDTKRAQTEREIDLIREYRTRLIADVVTGKLDVRNVDLTADLDELPGMDEALDDEPLDEIDDLEAEVPDA